MNHYADIFAFFGVLALILGMFAIVAKDDIRKDESCMVINEKSPPN